MLCFKIARTLKRLCDELGIPWVFKASYDKANRSSVRSFRGPGLEKGLRLLREIRDELGVPVLTDVHSPEEAAKVGAVVDIVQVPAFLCRQTDLLLAAGRTGRIVNVKKGQFLAPEDMSQVVQKLESVGNRHILLTERGSTFGYHNLVVDMRSIVMMRDLGYPVVFDATHAVQLPGGGGDRSGGQREYAPVLAAAAVAAGADGVFFETHPAPDRALSDGPNMVPLGQVKQLLGRLRAVREAVRTSE